jgi:hypothetical protein
MACAEGNEGHLIPKEGMTAQASSTKVAPRIHFYATVIPKGNPNIAKIDHNKFLFDNIDEYIS